MFGVKEQIASSYLIYNTKLKNQTATQSALKDKD